MPRRTTDGSELATIDIDVIDCTLVDLEETDRRPFIPPCHDDLPMLLYYEIYPTDHLWNPNRGLETPGEVVGFPLNERFFLNLLDKHLSYPVHTKPWFFSPFISANAQKFAVSRGNRVERPQAILGIVVDVMLAVAKTEGQQPYIYSLRRLVEEFQIPAFKYINRPYWQHEYLILRRVPMRFMKGYPTDAFDNCTSMLSWDVVSC